MSMFLLLGIFGLLLIVVEVFLFGGIFGVIGGILLILSSITFFSEYGIRYGIYYLLSLIFVVTLILVFVIGFLKHMPFGKFLFLFSSHKGIRTNDKEVKELVGKDGVVCTVLKPTGTVIIEGKKYEAVSETGYIDKGSGIKVIRVENNNLIVRQI